MPTHMRREIDEIPEAASRLLTRSAAYISSAEVLHGPVALVGRRFPVITFAALTSVRDTAEGGSSAGRIPFVNTGQPPTDVLLPIVPFYGFVEAWSRARGPDPDAPAALKKVTETR